MKPIKLTPANMPKIESAIEDVQSKAKIRLIDSYDILSTVEHLEQKLSNVLFKKDWAGLSFSIDENAQEFPASYNGTPESTKYILRREKSGWYFESVERSYTVSKFIQTNLRSKATEMADFVTRCHF